jgi:hypothetical protein
MKALSLRSTISDLPLYPSEEQIARAVLGPDRSGRLAGAGSRTAARANHCFGALAVVTLPPWLSFVRYRNVFPRLRKFDELRGALSGVQRVAR